MYCGLRNTRVNHECFFEAFLYGRCCYTQPLLIIATRESKAARSVFGDRIIKKRLHKAEPLACVKAAHTVVEFRLLFGMNELDHCVRRFCIIIRVQDNLNKERNDFVGSRKIERKKGQSKLE